MRWVAFGLLLGNIGCDVAVTTSGPVGSPTVPPTSVPVVRAGERRLAGRADLLSRPDVTPAGTGSSMCEACGGHGGVRGRVCAPSERVFVAGAAVTIDGTGCDGSAYHAVTVSGAEGDWAFDQVPCGTHVVTSHKGSFTADTTVTVVGGQVTDVTGAADKLCFTRDTTHMAVLGGDWDDLGGLVGDLGFSFDLYTDKPDAAAIGNMVGLLSDRVMLAEYDVLFIGCGHAAGRMAIEHPEVMDNVRDFVLAGGSLYTSDYAWTFGEAAFPDAVSWVNDDDPRSMGDLMKSPQQIPGGLAVTARVSDALLAEHLGRASLDIVFEEGPQIAPEAAGPGTTVHVAADLRLHNRTILQAPIALSYQPAPGAGRVVYTNFHNDAQATGEMLAVMRYLVLSL
jgi:hypothetical protein